MDSVGMSWRAGKQLAHSREQLVHLLAEAAELEHNLLCCYLYAAFSLKAQPVGRADNAAELIERWRQSIISTAVEEMTHLALIANLTVAVGARPHFNRPNLPVGPMYHPAGIVVELAPFCLDTLDHLIFLERPEGSSIADGKSFEQRRGDYQRSQTADTSLFPRAVDYETIGQFYEHLRSCLVGLHHELGAQVGADALFLGGANLQVGPDMLDLPGLITVSTLEDALTALDTIITQGEGGSGAEESHFARFNTIRLEYRSLLGAPGLDAAWPAARNPLMRRPADPDSGVHVTSHCAAAVLDLGNSVYALVVRLLSVAWGASSSNPGNRVLPRAALDASMLLMRVLGAIGRHVCSLPAADGVPGVNAGLTFTVARATEPLLETAARAWIVERLGEIRNGLDQLVRQQPTLEPLGAMLDDVVKTFGYTN